MTALAPIPWDPVSGWSLRSHTLSLVIPGRLTEHISFAQGTATNPQGQPGQLQFHPYLCNVSIAGE